MLDKVIEDDVAITCGLADDFQELTRSLGVTRNSVAYLNKIVMS